MQEIISVRELTKDYGNNKGVFDVNLQVPRGEVFGFLGPNGAGKTTTIRHLMGFIRPDEGECRIQGMDCFQDARKIQGNLGYLAGELSFLEDLTGRQLIDFIASMKGMKDKTRMKELTDCFELDPRGKIKKMSKGMKQKIGIVCAFMNRPEVLILDEPTSGLDPLMQNRFIELILEEKKRGTTIFMSSHIFEEVERTCDRTAMIRQGRIISIEQMDTLREKKKKSYVLTFGSSEDLEAFRKEGYRELEQKGLSLTVDAGGELSRFLQKAGQYRLKDLDVNTATLEDIFLHYYGGEQE